MPSAIVRVDVRLLPIAPPTVPSVSPNRVPPAEQPTRYARALFALYALSFPPGRTPENRAFTPQGVNVFDAPVAAAKTKPSAPIMAGAT